MGVIGAILVIVVSVIIVCGGGFFGVELGEDGAEDVCVAGAQAAQGGFGGASVAAAGLADEHGVAADRGDEGGIGKGSEEHRSELTSLMRISYAVFRLNKQMNNRP